MSDSLPSFFFLKYPVGNFQDASKLEPEQSISDLLDGSRTDSQLDTATSTSIYSICVCRMAAEEPLTIIHGRFKYKISLEGTMSDLRERIQEQSQIAPEQQTILHCGKKLNHPPETLLSELKLAGGKAMLMGKGAPPSQHMVALRQSEKKLNGISSKFTGIKEDIQRHTKGFLNASMTEEALAKDESELRLVDEACMRLLEELDQLTVPERSTDSWRAERKALVGKTQKVLSGVDVEREGIKDLLEDRWDELKMRRGMDS